MTSLLGIVLALGLLMALAYRGISVLVLAPLMALLAALLSPGAPLLASQGLSTRFSQDALRIKEAIRKARNAAGVAAPARLRNAAHGLFGRNPKGMG